MLRSGDSKLSLLLDTGKDTVLDKERKGEKKVEWDVEGEIRSGSARLH